MKIPQILYIRSWFHQDSWIPDEPNSNDYLFSDNYSLFKEQISSETVSLRSFCSPIEDQLHLGSCVANTVIGALELNRIKAGLPHKDFSRLFVYYNSRLAHNAIGYDKGTRIRYAMATLNSLGVSSEDIWPYDVYKVNTRPNWSAYRDAYKTKISGYYRIDGSYNEIIAQIKKALKSKHPVAFGCKVYKDFLDNKLQSGYSVRVPSSNENYVGRHAMLIVGYDETTKMFLIRNSWGKKFGNEGYCWMPATYFQAADAADFWVMTAYV